MECAYEVAAGQWECCSASVVMGSLALNFVSFPWFRVLSSWPDQLPGFHVFRRLDGAIVNCLISSCSSYPEQLNFVV